MRERAPAFRSADHNADSACKPRQRAPADQAGEVAAPDHSWAIEVSTADGHSWRNGVRLDTKAEAEAYILTHAAFEVDGYVTGRAIPCGDAPNCRVVSNRKGPYSRFRTAVACCWIGGEIEGEAYPNWAGYS